MRATTERANPDGEANRCEARADREPGVECAPSSKPPRIHRPEYVLFWDTETATDAVMGLNFGVYRCYQVQWLERGPRLACVEEGIFSADDLAERYPEGIGVLREYAQVHALAPAVDHETRDHSWQLQLRSLRSFNSLLCKLAYKARAQHVCFNYDFDVSRIAKVWGKAKGDRMRGGFWFGLGEYLDEETGEWQASDYTPRIATKSLNSKSSVKEFKQPSKRDRADFIPEDSGDGEPVEKWCFRGHPLDLRTLAFALSSKSHSLESACEAFGVLDPKLLEQELNAQGFELEALLYALGIQSVPDLTLALMRSTSATEIVASAALDRREAERLGALLDEFKTARALDEFGKPGKLKNAFQKRPVTHGEITPDYISYCREDVWATAALWEQLMAEAVLHPIDPERMYSPASVAKEYRQALGITPLHERQPDFPKDVEGFGAVAFYGGRTEVRIRRTHVPVIYLDFLSMYLLVCALLNVAEFDRCKRVQVVEEDPTHVQAWLEGLSLDDFRKPETWRELRALVLIEPEGDIVPARADYAGRGEGYSIGLNPLVSSPSPLWYPMPDVVVDTVLPGGRVPKILRVLRLAPEGETHTLRPGLLRGSIPVDPREQDLFRFVVEERQRQKRLGTPESERVAAFLKTVGLAGCYGIFGQQDRQQLPKGKDERVTVRYLSEFEADTATPEDPGEYAFMPLAALIASGAHLLLALLERKDTDLGGTYLNADTDAMAIVVSEQGGLVPCEGGPYRMPDGREAVLALSLEQVQEIVDWFKPLNPFDRKVITKSVLEVEEENKDPHTGEPRQLYGYAIAAKRYAFYNLDENGEPILRKYMESGLGHYLDPLDLDSDDRNHMKQLWEYIVRIDALGLPTPEPDWLDRPAVSKASISKAHTFDAFDAYNAGKPRTQQIRPHNFLLNFHVPPGGHPPVVDPARFRIVAPYNSDPRLKLSVINIYDGTNYRTTTTGLPEPGIVRVKTWRDVLNVYRTHPEPKSIGPDQLPCHRGTKGLLSRRPVKALSVAPIGKEANELEAVQAGHVPDEDEVLNRYGDGSREAWLRHVPPILREIPVATIVELSGLSPMTVKNARAGRPPAKRQHRDRLASIAAEYAREHLRSHGIEPQRRDLAACALYNDERDNFGARHCRCGCGEQLIGQQKEWYSEACRKRAARAANTQPTSTRNDAQADSGEPASSSRAAASTASRGEVASTRKVATRSNRPTAGSRRASIRTS